MHGAQRLSRFGRSSRLLIGSAMIAFAAIGCAADGGVDEEAEVSAGAALVAPNMGTMFVTREELAAKPTSGAGWSFLKAKADLASFGTPTLADQDALTQSHVLAAALVYARTGDASYREKVIAYVKQVPGTELAAGSRVLSVARTLYGYVVSADLVGMSLDTPCRNGQTWRQFLAGIRTKVIPGNSRWSTLAFTAADSSTNWGAYALATHLAVSYALGDAAAVTRDTNIFRRYAGDRTSPAAPFQPSEGYRHDGNGATWDMTPTLQVGINPASATDPRAGAMIEDILRDPDAPSRRCCTPSTSGITYSEESMDGVFSTAMLLRAHGFDVRSIGGEALRRTFAYYITHGGPGPYSLSRVLPYVVNHWYGTQYPTRTEDRPYRHLGYGSWLFTGGSASPPPPPPPSTDDGAPVLRAASASPGGTVATLAIARPAGTAAGDLLVASVVCRASSAITPPAGFALLRDLPSGGTHLATFVKTATSAEPASYAFTIPAPAGIAGGITSWSRASAVEASAGAIGPDATVELPAVTTAAADRVVLAVYAQIGSVTYAPPAGFTEHLDVRTPSGTYLASIAQASRVQATAGTTAPAVATASGTGGGWLAQTIAIR